MSRTIWVIGNWKQNLLRGPAAALASTMSAGLPAALSGQAGLRVGVAPTYLALEAVSAHTGRSHGQLELFAQDIAAQEQGAFTGEVGTTMLGEVGVHAAIIGHSERRAQFGDTDVLVGAKLRNALAGGFDVVLCVGEQLAQRDAGEHEQVVVAQLSAAFADLQPPAAERVTIAYEPVWAIGTGRTASPEQASGMHAAIRAWLDQAGLAGADRSILYGGSVKPANASALLEAGEIDGFLVGGASLDASAFLDIVTAAASHLQRTVP